MSTNGSVNSVLSLLLGANLGYAGDIATLPAMRAENMARIGRVAIRRLGGNVGRPGGISTRMAGCLVEDGAYVTDPVTCEYWGGVFASSWSAGANDDRGVRILKQLARLSTYQVRTHYLFYATLCRLFRNAGAKNIDFDSGRYRMAVFAPAVSFSRAMGFDAGESSRMASLVTDSLTGLGVELLVDGSNTGSENYLKKFFKTNAIVGEGIVFAPSLPGVRLFLWAFGAGEREARYILEPAFDCAVPGFPELIEDSAFVYD